jgi:hypothetical protein
MKMLKHSLFMFICFSGCCLMTRFYVESKVDPSVNMNLTADTIYIQYPETAGLDDKYYGEVLRGKIIGMKGNVVNKLEDSSIIMILKRKSGMKTMVVDLDAYQTSIGVKNGPVWSGSLRVNHGVFEKKPSAGLGILLGYYGKRQISVNLYFNGSDLVELPKQPEK